MWLNILIETNAKIEDKKYTIYKATYIKTVLLKNVFLKRSV